MPDSYHNPPGDVPAAHDFLREWRPLGWTTDAGMFSAAAESPIIGFDTANATGVAYVRDPDGTVRAIGRLTNDGLHPPPSVGYESFFPAHVVQETGERVLNTLRGSQPDQPARPGRPADPIRTTGSAADVLDAIDNAVGLPDGQVCACGCGRELRPDGPSEFFATQECQQNWHNTNVTDPDEVYEGDDAVPYPGASLGPPPPTVTARDEPIWPCEDRYGAGYRVPCQRCGEAVIPVVRRTWDPNRLMRLRHKCPRCQDELAGPVYTASLREEANRLRFELGDGSASVGHVLPVRDLYLCADRSAVVAAIWQALANDLARFRRGWHGRTGPGGRVDPPAVADLRSLFRHLRVY